MGKIVNKLLREFIDEVNEEGWFLEERCGSGHLKMRHRVSQKVCYLPSSPSDHRALKNCRSQMRRLAKIETKVSQ